MLFGECENYLITIWNENCIAVKVNVIPLGTQTHAAETWIRKAFFRVFDSGELNKISAKAKVSF